MRVIIGILILRAIPHYNFEHMPIFPYPLPLSTPATQATTNLKYTKNALMRLFIACQSIRFFRL